MWNQKEIEKNFFVYINAYINPEFMLKIYYQSINLGITIHNSESSVVVFSRNIQLLMSTSIVIIDQEFGMMQCFRCNHIPFSQLRHDCSISQFVCDLYYFLVDSKCFTSKKLLFTISFSRNNLEWNFESQRCCFWLKPQLDQTQKSFQGHYEHSMIQCVSVFDSTSAYYILMHKICWTPHDSL